MVRVGSLDEARAIARRHACDGAHNSRCCIVASVDRAPRFSGRSAKPAAKMPAQRADWGGDLG